MRVLFINSVIGFGSTGNIVLELASLDGVEPFVIFGRKENNTKLNDVYKMTNYFGNAKAALETFVLDKHGFTNVSETEKTIEIIKEFKPDVIHLHNLHGYYLNIETLINYLKKSNIPVIWTFHDCWPLTGYCPHFDYIGCDKWEKECNNCPKPFMYPFSIFKQHTKDNYYKKKQLYKDFNNLIIVTPSDWLKNQVKKSILKDKTVITINNGIDLSIFRSSCHKSDRFSILFVSSIWTKTKGLDEMIEMIKMLDKDIEVTIVGKYVKPDEYLKTRCNLIDRTENVKQLVDLYSKSHLFVNMTLEETFGLVNVESLACGTPVITYNTGGSPETINGKCGLIVEKHNYQEMAKKINDLKNKNDFSSEECVLRAKEFGKERMLNSYLSLYKEVTDG